MYLDKFYILSILIYRTNCFSLIVAPGVSYDKIEYTGPTIIHELCVDPYHAKVVLAASHNTSTGSQTTSEISKEHNAIAAINGGFFDFGVTPIEDKIIKLLDLFGYHKYDAFPIFLSKIDNMWFSLSNVHTGVLAWKNDKQNPVIGITKSKWSLKLNDCIYPIKDLNKPLASKPCIYTENYGGLTPKNCNYVDIIIENNRVVNILLGGGNMIHENQLIYSCNYLDPILNSVKIGDPAIILRQYDSDPTNLNDKLNEMDYILASTPLLLINGNIPDLIESNLSSFFTKKHPRSAIGILDDGTWILIVVDGRTKQSEGFSLKELAYYMKSRGCIHALNLDGGGSSTLVIKNTVVNTPSGRKFSLVKKERPVSNALLVFPNSLDT